VGGGLPYALGMFDALAPMCVPRAIARRLKGRIGARRVRFTCFRGSQ
jgi:hypothetical protein